MKEEKPIRFMVRFLHPNFLVTRKEAFVDVWFMPDGTIVLDGYNWLTRKQYDDLQKMKPLEPEEGG